MTRYAYEPVLKGCSYHRGGISSLAFSPCGRFLVTVDDGDAAGQAFIICWEIKSNEVHYAIHTSFAHSVVLWPTDPVGILVASRDGSLSTIKTQNSDQVLVTTYSAHSSGIDRATYNCGVGVLATAAADGLWLWHSHDGNRSGWKVIYKFAHTFSKPVVLGQIARVIGLAFESDQIIHIVYAEVSVICKRDLRTGALIAEVPIDAGLKSDYSYLRGTRSLSLYGHGFEVYDADSGICKNITKWRSDDALPILLVNEGLAFLHGTQEGGVVMRPCKDLGSSAERKEVILQVHDVTNRVSALAFAVDGNACAIAAGTTAHGASAAVVQVWRSRALPEVTSKQNYSFVQIVFNFVFNLLGL